MSLAECSVSLFLAGRRLLKKSEPLLERGSVRSAGCGPRPFYDPNRLARGQPLQIISGPNLVLVGDRLRKRELKLTRNFGHDGSITRITSLFNPCLRSHWPPPARIDLSHGSRSH